MEKLVYKLIRTQQTLYQFADIRLNFIISIIYAQNLTLDDRGILSAAILYPQLAIGLFSFGMLRSLPKTL